MMALKSEAKSPGRSAGTDATSLDIYLEQINKIPLLTVDEEREVATRAKAGDKSALDQLVSANLRFVVSVAKQYANQGIPIEDLVNEGNLGLIKAAQRFDVDRGFKFISYAVWWIRQGMLHALSQSSRIVRVPMNRSHLLYKVGKATRELDQELERTPTPEEVAKRTNLAVDDVLDAARISNSHVSLDEKISGEGDDKSFVEQLEDEEGVRPDEATFNGIMSRDLNRALATLSQRERQIMEMYYGLNGQEALTLEDIGKEIGLTRERIRQIKEQAIQRLRHHSRSRFLEDYA